MSEKRGIDYRFKILYAVAMIMIVCGHAKTGGIGLLKDWFPYRGIHLAIFIFCSGYFYKEKNEDNVLLYIWKKIKTLVIPMYIYNVIYGLVVMLSRYKGFKIGDDFTAYNLIVMPWISGHQFGYNLAGWFIAPLFMVEVYNVVVRKLVKGVFKIKTEWFFFVLNLCLGIAGINMACKGYNEVGVQLMFVRMAYFLPFFELGVIYKSDLEKYERKIPSFWYFSVIIAIKLAIALKYGEMPRYNPVWSKDFEQGPIMAVLIGYLGIAMWLRIATILEPAIGRSKPLNMIADNTYSIMMNHIAGFMIVKYVIGIVDNFVPLGFDWALFKSDKWYYWLPDDNNKYFLIVYIAFGIVFSILIQMGINYIKQKIKKK